MKPWIKLWKEKMLSSLNFQSLFSNEKALYSLIYFYVRDDKYAGGLCYPNGTPITLEQLNALLKGRLDELKRIVRKLVELGLLYYDINQILCIRNYAKLVLYDGSISDTPNLPLIPDGGGIGGKSKNPPMGQQPIRAKSLKSTRNPPIDKDKEEDKEKETTQSQIQELFSQFWLVYPRKVKRKDTLIKWMKLSKKYKQEFITITVPLIFKSIEKQKTSEQWNEAKGKFIPYPASWLNGERWNDEVVEKGDWRDG